MQYKNSNYNGKHGNPLSTALYLPINNQSLLYKAIHAFMCHVKSLNCSKWLFENMPMGNKLVHAWLLKTFDFVIKTYVAVLRNLN